MNKQNTPQKHFPIKKIIGLVLGLAVIIGGGYWIVITAQNNTRNYAKEIAKPIEKALVEARARKVCETGDNGRGWDNKAPWYGATYLLQSNKDEAIQLIYEVAKKDGYNLEHATPTNRGKLDAVADVYINDWYFDITSKKNPYKELDSGNAELSISVRGDGTKISCKDVVTSQGESLLGINVRLPSFRP